MAEEMPGKSRVWLEAECLRVTKQQLGCGQTERVTIRSRHSIGSRPNWEPHEFFPPLPMLARMRATAAIVDAVGKHALVAAE
jgi:hypothetical protein